MDHRFRRRCRRLGRFGGAGAPVSFVAMLGLLAASCGTPSTEQATAAPAPGLKTICGEIELNGVTSQAYDDRNMCVADLAGLRDRASRDARERCQSFCADMGCQAEEMAYRRRPGAICQIANPRTLRAYGIGNTGQFICACVARP